MIYPQVHWLFCYLCPVIQIAETFIYYYLFNFHFIFLCIFYFFSDTFYFNICCKMLEIAYWSIFIITTLKSLSDNSNIYIISTLVSTDWLYFPIQFSWLFICRIILNSILNILNTVLWGFEYCLNSTENVDVFVFVLAQNCSG